MGAAKPVETGGFGIAPDGAKEFACPIDMELKAVKC